MVLRHSLTLVYDVVETWTDCWPVGCAVWNGTPDCANTTPPKFGRAWEFPWSWTPGCANTTPPSFGRAWEVADSICLASRVGNRIWPKSIPPVSPPTLSPRFASMLNPPSQLDALWHRLQVQESSLLFCHKICEAEEVVNIKKLMARRPKGNHQA